MISGIFSATLISNQNKAGCGVAVFSGNAIYGGDASHYYRGKYKLDEKNLMSGTIEVFKYSNLQNSVFGPLEKFKLLLNGQVIVNDKEFELSGRLKDIQNSLSELY